MRAEGKIKLEMSETENEERASETEANEERTKRREGSRGGPRFLALLICMTSEDGS